MSWRPGVLKQTPQRFILIMRNAAQRRFDVTPDLVRPETHPSLCDSFAADSTERRRSADSPRPDFR